MAKQLNKPLPADAEVPAEDVPSKPSPVPQSTETLENGAIVETF